jgi:uncharacterized protein with ParB-like and HNH nuclease domain
MAENNVSLKTINDLLEYNFFIPSYQRGYRWTERQVKDLLDDIWEFIDKSNKKDEEWYCLQPIVSTNDENTKKINNLTGDWQVVIDGQQRLTTIFLILKHLERFVESEKKNFEIQYETRKDSKSYLYEIENKSESDSEKNVDFYHIYNAFKTVKTWFQTKVEEGHNSISSKFISPFLEKVKVIWYETSKDEDAIDIFTRINSGKIPLTNAELIKALFLNSSNFPKADPEKLRLKQLEIATEWDRIEYALQDDSFWYFINKNENNLATRIEFVFDLMYEVETENSVEEKFGNDEYTTFRFFNEKFKTKSEKDINDNWQEVKKCFQTLEEWYNDRELYHKVGYLITIGVNIKDILIKKEGETKTGFIELINKKIEEEIKDIDLEQLKYGDNRVRKLLLLHNVQTMLNNKNETSRFPFYRYKIERWDVEHIHAIASNVKVKEEDQAKWLKNNFIKTDEPQKKNNFDKMCIQIEKIINSGKSTTKENFSKIIDFVLGKEDNSLQNLCLLDSSTNRSYKNDSFKEKRRKIIERELEGTFIPICTKNVFMKYYTNDVKSIEIWNEDDRNSYFNNIEEVTKKYLPQTE